MGRRFIEESFPVKEVGAESAKEKNIRHGHISTLHIWWARKPLAVSRVTAYAALTPALGDPVEWQKKRNFIVELCKWENSNDSRLINRAREEILKANGGVPPRVIDPFAGGGSYPLEAMRLGCEVYANDYNPVAVLIEKATLEYPQRFRKLDVRNWELMLRTIIGGKDDGKSQRTPNNQVSESDSNSDQDISSIGTVQSDILNNEKVSSISENSQGCIDEIRDAPNNRQPTPIYGRVNTEPDFSGDLDDWEDFEQSNFFSQESLTTNSQSTNPLLTAVKYWGNWVLEEAKKELLEFYVYPTSTNSQSQTSKPSIPVGFIWARTIPCQNPTCNAEIPLMRQFWLAKKEKKKISLYPVVDRERNRIEFGIIEKRDGKWEYIEKPPISDSQIPTPNPQFEPEDGTVSRANVRCPACGGMVDDKTTRRLFQVGKAGQRMVAVVETGGGRGSFPEDRGKSYRLATDADMDAYLRAEKALEQKVAELRDKWGMEPVPDEEMNQDDPTTVAGRGYSIKKWGDLFNSRQKLSLIVFCDAVRRAYEKMKEYVSENWELGVGEQELGEDEKKTLDDFAKAVATYLGIMVDRISSSNNTICRWQPCGEKIADAFGRQALAMIWDYAEANQITGKSRSWMELFKDIRAVIENNSFLIYSANTANFTIPNSQSLIPKVTNVSATNLPYPDNYFDAVLTDPPYYDNVPYSYLSDFFYVWLKRSVGHLYPDLFATPLTPKSREIVAYPEKQGGKDLAKAYFEEQLALSFKEMYRVLKPGGIAVI
ncbi:MAG: DUF1156 domain-containing protein, partial [Candidatus Hydrogenedentes bacterium]|nr:DUF1156 domain-containing protein [Candidatus Hydrogenedentota bacterium]